VVGVTVTFDYTDGFDRSRLIKVAENGRAVFEGMPGLRYKFFTFDPDRSRAMNFYTAPTIAFVEIPEMVENGGVEA
jgi:hypothetical protein